MTEAATESSEAVWFPPTCKTLTSRGDAPVLIAVTGESGVGKSHLGHQLLVDPDYGPNEVGFIMSEKSLTSYDFDNIHYDFAKGLSDAGDIIDSYRRAATLGKRLPKTLFFDSLSASCDGELQRYASEMTFTGQSGRRDKLSEYGDLGAQGQERLSVLRNELPCDIVLIVRTKERGRAAPELAIPGKIIPDNLTGWTDVTLYMKAEFKRFTDEERAAIGTNLDKFRLPHRTFGTDDSGVWDGTMIQRYFYTQNTGEVLAKGHHNLNMKERAIIGDVLRKIHGRKPLY